MDPGRVWTAKSSPACVGMGALPRVDVSFLDRVRRFAFLPGALTTRLVPTAVRLTVPTRGRLDIPYPQGWKLFARTSAVAGDGRLGLAVNRIDLSVPYISMQNGLVMEDRGPHVGSVERLFEAESGRMWRSLTLHLGDSELAKDATAEAFAQLLRRADDVRDPRAWVWRAAFRIADREQKRNRISSTNVAATYDFPEPVVDLMRALRALPPTQRKAVVLYHLEDRPISEIAEVLGTSRAAVGVHLHRGRRRLESLLEERDA
jgi:RNA polymerase sigma-70 factor (ECF subfamily)